ncbi:hypothetical protein RND71_029003 [Anisodus tanguticus]|uniref:Plant thionin family protein n=1 Tax=Anisodus tanguticus TaxID=243964 RepID=A0AAE1VAK6_9SOLA|nr:hypothetical protein RND71_029003 [Anisodus tanguticus]
MAKIKNYFVTTLFLICILVVLIQNANVSIAAELSDKARECMPTCLAVSGSTVTSCEKACQDFAKRTYNKR